MKLHEFFFFLQAHAEIFFSSSISCMNFFLDLTPPSPRISNGPPLSSAQKSNSLITQPNLEITVIVCGMGYHGRWTLKRLQKLHTRAVRGIMNFSNDIPGPEVLKALGWKLDEPRQKQKQRTKL